MSPVLSAKVMMNLSENEQSLDINNVFKPTLGFKKSEFSFIEVINLPTKL